ncbi:MAG TPA: peptidylprolyl isomerase [Gemmatimonadales bacterium]|nr:peptidylprolyl isomerase [Gemmatimonadales bacterium]
MTVRAWRLAPLIALALVAVACRRGERPDAASSHADPAASRTTAGSADFRDPTSVAMKERAPATFRAGFETSKGPFVIEVHRDWAPLGADRFYNLVRSGYYDGARFFRVISGFMAQFGIHGDPQVSAAWRGARIPDDPVRQRNTRGAVSFATAGPGTRTTQLFINYGDNSRLDSMGFAPFGRVVEGMDVVDRLHAGYGEGAPRGRGPDQGRIEAEGNAYLEREFPELDQVRRATIVAP